MVAHAHAYSPYGREGRIGSVTIGPNDEVRDGVHSLNVYGNFAYAFFLPFRCSRADICKFEARLPLNRPMGECAGILFGDHQHQLVGIQILKFN
jgi:hypothetical protein